MRELVLVKLGGSLITDKLRPETARLDTIQRLAKEIAQALAQRPTLSLVLGHGSGSFGHIQAQRYHVHEGGLTDWMGYAQTGAAAQRLNRIVTDALLEAGVPAVSLQPSASALCRQGELLALSIEPVQHLLAHGAVPLLYGDVAIDAVQGSTIVSTEQVLAYIARNLGPTRFVEVGEVEGVYTTDPHHDPNARLLPRITPSQHAALAAGLQDSHAVDVTGGMRSKVATLLALIQTMPGLTARIISGETPGALATALLDPQAELGTLLCAD
ncbi:MAG: isopentenyl phosphate kinase [Anaerolineales bacterium]